MIESVMLVALGFLLASLLWVLFAPAFWARAVRLTTARIKSSLPVSETEIRAEKDQLRAQYAVRVHQLGKEIEKARLAAARQLVELNRRDARITEFEANVARLQSDLEENQNARRVLEQTLNERVPRIETRLEEARRLLRARDREIAMLGAEAEKQRQALEQASILTRQQSERIEQLQTSLSLRQVRERRRFVEPGREPEDALRSEVEALRNRAREQASVIERLKERALAVSNAHSTSRSATEPVNGSGAMDIDSTDEPEGIGDTPTGGPPARRNGSAGVQDRLRALSGKAQADAGEGAADTPAASAETSPVNNHEAAAPHSDEGSSETDKPSVKSRILRLEGELKRQTERSQRLKAELAAANERAARQAAYYHEELKRLGTGPASTSAPASGERQVSRRALLPVDGGPGREEAADAQSAAGAGRHGDRASQAAGSTSTAPEPDARASESVAEGKPASEHIDNNARSTAPEAAGSGDTPDTEDAGGRQEADTDDGGKPRSRLLERLRTYEST